MTLILFRCHARRDKIAVKGHRLENSSCKNLIDHIPFLDLVIIGLLVLFLYVGWNQGMPRMMLILGSVYSGFLLAAIYYHMFARIIARTLNLKLDFATDLISFLALEVVVTLLLMSLVLSLFGHIAIKGRPMIYDKVGGTVAGLLCGMLLVGLTVMVLRIPHEANINKLNAFPDTAVTTVFDNAYGRSFIAPQFMKNGTPVLLDSLKPLLPVEVKEQGYVPLMQSVAVQQSVEK